MATLIYRTVHRGALHELYHGSQGRQALVVYSGDIHSAYLVNFIILRKMTGECIERITGSGAFAYAMMFISAAAMKRCRLKCTNYQNTTT